LPGGEEGKGPVFPCRRSLKNVIADVEERLKSGEYKMTPRRAHILRALIENQGRHLSAEEVYQLVKEKEPELGLATVYRTLELFSDRGIIHGMDFGDGRKRYEMGLGTGLSHHHHHLICTQCGRIIEVGEDLLEDLEMRVYREYGFAVADHQLKMFGLCGDCDRASAGAGDTGR